VDVDKSDKVAFTALLVLVWLAAAWWALKQLPYITGIERTYFLNRIVLCLLVYGVFIAYYVWRSFKPEHWALRDHDDY
jgi:peptidoglycan/LPS O-acetylase OafA/YrhL